MWSLPHLGLLVLSPIMAIAWAVQRRTRNAGVVDVLWCLGLAGLGGFYGLAAEGWAPRRLLVGGLAFTWYVRLGMHLAHRVSSEEEDGRYKGLREELGTRFDTWIFWFFQAQAFLAVLLSLAFLVPAGGEPSRLAIRRRIGSLHLGRGPGGPGDLGPPVENLAHGSRQPRPDLPWRTLALLAAP